MSFARNAAMTRIEFRLRSAAMVFLAAAFTVAPCAQSTPPVINFQGRLTDNTPQQTPFSGTAYLQFALFDAATGGVELWREPAGAAQLPVSVLNGVFSVQLGANGVPLPTPIFSGGASRWLELRIGADTLAPRQKVASAGYAMHAASAADAAQAGNASQLGGVAPANYQRRVLPPACPTGQLYAAIAADGTATCAPDDDTPQYPLNFTASNYPVALITLDNAGTGASGSTYGLKATGGVAGVYGRSTDAYGAGVYGDNVNGYGIRGLASATTGGATGVYGESASDSGYGVSGFAGSASGTPVGVRGASQGTAGYGVLGQATASSGVNYGVFGMTSSPAGYGLYTPNRAYAGAGYQQPGSGGEALRMLRGRLASNGSIAAGGGFTAIRGSAGIYTITFSTAFSSAPAVTANPEGGTNACATVSPSATSVTIRTFLCSTNALTDIALSFTALGNP